MPTGGASIATGRPRVITLLRSFPTFSEPKHVRASNGCEYVIKGRLQTKLEQMQSCLPIDHVIGRVASSVSDVVPCVTLLDLCEDVRRDSLDMVNMYSGIVHATVYRPDLGPRMGIANTEIPANRRRFSLLALLYTWGNAGDTQYFYGNTDKHVWSFDHGHFIQGGGAWNAASLRDLPTTPSEFFQEITLQADLTHDELLAAGHEFGAITPKLIWDAIQCVPDEWGRCAEDMQALGNWLIRRHEAVIRMLG